MARASLATSGPLLPYPDIEAEPDAQWQALRIALWVGEQQPDLPVRLVRSPAEQIRALFVGPGGARVQLLLTLDWPARAPTVVSAGSLAAAVRSSTADDAGGLNLGVEALVAVPAEPEDDTSLPYTLEPPWPMDEDRRAKIGKQLTQGHWAKLVNECLQVWQSWDGHGLPEPGPRARWYNLTAPVAATLGQLYPLGRENRGQLVTVQLDGQTLISGQFIVVGPPLPLNVSP